MAKVWVTERHLEDIAEALRRKGKTGRRFYPSEMADAVDALSGDIEGGFPLRLGHGRSGGSGLTGISFYDAGGAKGKTGRCRCVYRGMNGIAGFRKEA